MTPLNVTAHVLYNSNLGFILIFAILDLWLIQH